MSVRWRLRAYAPALASEYSIRPWELDLLTLGEAIRFIGDLERRAELSDPDSKTNKARERNKTRAKEAGDRLLRKR